MQTKVLFKTLTEGCRPNKQTAGAAAYDLMAAENYTLPPFDPHDGGSVVKVRGGFAMALEFGWQGSVRTRSGFGTNKVVIYMGSGLIDADYRGEVIMPLLNVSRTPVVIEKGERICQMLIEPVPEVVEEDVSELPETVRGEGGFGHTGTK